MFKAFQTRFEHLIYGDSHVSTSNSLFYPPTLFVLSIGSLYILSFTYKLIVILLDVYVLPGIPLTKYGAGRSTSTSASKPKAWAIVTGATDGIGREFALQLARAGFSILLASRSAEKLAKVASEIKVINPAIETKVVTIDFSSGDQSQYSKLESAIEVLKNVGVLINNVGKSHDIPVPFAETSLEEMLSISEINVNATLRVTRMVVPGMVSQKKGLILNLGSFAGQFPSPLLTTYSGTKSFLISFSQALGEELRRSKIDVQCLNTYFVVSNMSKIRKSSSMIPTPRQYVQQALKKIGRGGGAFGRPYTMTVWPMHALVDWAVQTFVPSQKWFLQYNHDQLLSTRKRAIKKAERSAKSQ
ncbi:hypothetical protein CBS101457_005605 [Exobasidium rhododendri]|nr:hypothetical protein CBS101457_005605 [Exobasidium rhododendri]